MKPLEILTKKEFGKNGKPIFKNQAEIVNSIFKIAEPDFKNIESLRAFLNQTINGERKLSEKLKKVLFQLLPERLEDKSNIVNVQNLLLESFESNYKKRSVSKITDLDQMLLRAKSADNILVITPEPAEIKDNKVSNQLKRELLEKIGILESTEKQAKFTFYFPHPLPDEIPSISFRFWKGLYDFMVSNGISNPIEKLSKINQGKNAKIEVYSIQRNLCWLPVVIYDIGRQSQRAFIVIYYNDESGQERTSVARLAGDTLKSWKDLIYNKLNDNKESITNDNNNEYEDNLICEVSFKSVIEDIQKNEGVY